MGLKKFIMGEKMPDKNDPQYRERYEREVNAGQKVARFLKIDKAAAATQRLANRSPKVFLAVIFGIVILCFGLNIYRLAVVSRNARSYQTAVEKQENIYRHNKLLTNPNELSDNGNEATEKD